MKQRFLAGLALVALVLAMPAVARGGVGVRPGGGRRAPHPTSSSSARTPRPAGRGMNAALAAYGRYLYVGNRTDGSSRCGAGDPRGTVDPDSCPHPHPGIQVVDVADPASPTVVGEFGEEFVTGTN